MRVLFWLGLIALVYFALRSKWQAAARNMQQKSPPSTAVAEDKHPAEKMLVCAHCAVYFPASEAVQSVIGEQTLVFCSNSHQQQYRAH